MNLNIFNLDNFEDVNEEIMKMNITDEYCENFSMYDMIHWNKIGDKLYKLKIDCAWNLLNPDNIIYYLETNYPEMKNLNINTLFDKEKYPKYIRTDICTIIKDKLPFNTYIKLSNEIDKYWEENIITKIKSVEDSFEEVNNSLALKLENLEKYPNVIEAFNLFDKIKEEVMETSLEKIKNWKKNDYHSLMTIYNYSCDYTLKYFTLQQIKEDLFKRLEKSYPIIFKEICNSKGIDDEKLIDTLLHTSGVNKEMLKLSITFLFMSESL